MLTLVPDAVEAYARDHSAGVHAVYSQLQEITWSSTDCPQMQVGPIEGRLLMVLARMVGARRAIEVGTFTGYSALSIAEGMADGGRLVTCDIDPESTAIAQRHWDMVPWGERIELRLGPALETLKTLEGPIDLAFVDADKSSYAAYWELLVPMLRPGGVLVVDNVLWSGRVLDPRGPSDHAIAAFNDHVLQDGRVDHVMLTVRDGITLAVKR